MSPSTETRENREFASEIKFLIPVLLARSNSQLGARTAIARSKRLRRNEGYVSNHEPLF